MEKVQSQKPIAKSLIHNAALIGCGDYLRWEIEKLNSCKLLKVTKTFDLDKAKSEKRASQLFAKAVESLQDIFEDHSIEIILIFTPPVARKELFKKAVESNKQIITTKPLAPSYKEALELFNMTKGKVECAVFYRRAGNASIEKLKEILRSNEIGQLALYKEEWYHHYPQWNNWATDPEKNGGPFMDAMIHNLNIARYLSDSKVISCNFFSDNHAQQLKCNDTEFLKVNFENGASAHLFITWAADLEVFDLTGNDREHYGITHIVTDKGWYVKEVQTPDGLFIEAKREHEIKRWKVTELPLNPYDDFVRNMEKKIHQNHDIAFALEDNRILDFAMKNVTKALEI